MPVNELKTASTFSIPGGDKIIHFILFAILTFLVVKAIEEQKKSNSAWKIFVILGLFGLSTEIGQHFIVDRNADILDLVADIFGIGCTLLILKNHFR